MTNEMKTTASVGEPRRVIVADRDPTFAALTAVGLTKLGFVTETAKDFDDIVKRVASFPAQLAVIDIRLDTNDGIDLINALEKARPGILCLMITELLEPQSSVRALRAGAFDFLSRPIDIDVLAALLDRGFERLHLEAQKIAAESALKESEARFRAFFDNTPVAMNLKDVESRFLMINKPYETWLEKTGDEIIGKTMMELKGVNERTRQLDTIEKRVFETGLAQEEEITVVKDDGSVHHRIVIKFPVKNDDGPVSAIGTVALEITERQRAEAARRESEAQLRAIIDNYPSLITLKDLEGRYLLVNDAFATSRGISIDEALGASPAEIENPEQAAIVNAHDEEALRLGKAVTYERDWPNAQGERHPRAVIKFPAYDADGSLMGVGTISSDITERKKVEEALRRSEEQFRAFIDNSPMAVMLKDLKGRYLLVNETFRRWNNIRRDIDCHGKTVRDLFSKEIADEVMAHEKLVAKNRRLIVENREMRFADGVMRKTWVHKFPIYGGDGECTGVGTVDVDVTSQRDLEEQLAQAQKMEAVGQLTGGVAHDFNNLLGIIIGNLDFLAEQTSDDPAKHAFVVRATKAALNGAKLVRQLLAFSRRQPLSPQIVDLHAHVRNMFDLLQRSLGESVIIKTKSSHGPWTAEVDPAQLESALLNLAVNARDAMPSGGILTFETKKVRLDANIPQENLTLQPGDYVMLAVTDTGTGMPQEAIAQAFEPFFTTKAVGEGSGLGLSMVYGFTKQSGGDVVIESRTGTGTTIRLYLPYAESLSDASPVRDEEQPRAKGETILVVEDDTDLLTLTATLLNSLGYSVLQASDGTTALEILDSAADVDLLLTDIVMPGPLRGPALAAKAIKKRPNLKMLYMSGYSADAVTSENTEDGIELLRKPFRRSTLAQSIRATLDP